MNYGTRRSPAPTRSGRTLVALAVAVSAGQLVLVSFRIGQAAAIGWIRQWLRPRRARGARRAAAVRQRAGRPSATPAPNTPISAAR